MDTDRIQRVRRVNEARRARAAAQQPTTNGQATGNGRPQVDPMLVFNAMTQRQDLLSTMFDPRRDINDECGYPNEISDDQYRQMYDRERVPGRNVADVAQDLRRPGPGGDYAIRGQLG